jgi:hypothetical protein
MANDSLSSLVGGGSTKPKAKSLDSEVPSSTGNSSLADLVSGSSEPGKSKSVGQKILSAPGVHGLLKGASIVGDIISRPGEAVLSAGRGGAEGRDKGVAAAIGGAASGFARGALGKEHLTFRQALGGRDVQTHGILQHAEDILGSIATDPLTYATLGTGDVAKEGLQIASKSLGKDVAENIAQQGVKKGLSAGEKAAVRKSLVEHATEGGITPRRTLGEVVRGEAKGGVEEGANRFADRTMRALETRGQGGLGVHIPGTSVGVNLIKGSTIEGGLEKTGLRAAEGAIKGTGAAQTLAKAFHTGAKNEQRFGKEVGGIMNDAEKTRETAADVALENSKRSLDLAARKVPGGLTEADNRLVGNAIAAGEGAVKALKAERPELSEYTDTVRQIHQDSAVVPQAAQGVLAGTEKAVGPQTRVVTSAGAKAQKDPVRFAQALGEDAANAAKDSKGNIDLQKLYPGLTAQQINEKVAPRLQQAGLLKDGERVLHEGAYVGALSDATVAAKTAAQREYIDKIGSLKDERTGKNILIPAEGVSEGKIPPGYRTVNLGDMGTFHAPTEIADDLEKSHAISSSSEELTKLGKFYKEWNGMWKSGATIIPIGGSFTARNARSNVFLNYLAGVTNPVVYKDALGIQMKVRSVLRDKTVDPTKLEQALAAKLGTKNYRIYKEARDTGALGTSFFQHDILKGEGGKTFKGAFGEASTGGKAKAIGKQLTHHGKVAELGGKGNQIVEDNARLAHFIAKREELGSSKAAAESVKKYLFDYGDLTEFEKKTFGKVIPFYCVPTDHEILTKRGWKTFDQLVLNEPVMVFDPETHVMRWEPIQEVAIFDYDGELWTTSRTGGLSLSYTPNHRWPTQTGTIKEAQEFLTSDRVPFRGEFEESNSLLDPRLAAILGWVVTDGHGRWRKNHWEAVVYQSPKKFLAQIIDLLGTSPHKPHPTTGVVAVPVSLEDKKSLTKHYHDKSDLPSLVTQLSRESAEAMWQAMFDAEGSTSSRGQQCFTQMPGPVLDAFQILTYMTGRSARICTARRKTSNLYVSTQQGFNLFNNLTKSQFKGQVWCPRTPTGTWVVRHDGLVMPTGNTFMRKNTPLQVEQLFKNPGKYAMRQHIIEGSMSSPDQSAPEYLQDGRVLPANIARLLTGQSDRQVLTSPDSAISAAEQATAPLHPTSWRDFNAKTLGTVGGPIPSILNSLASEATGHSTFTGNALKGGTQARAERIASSLLPVVGRGKGLISESSGGTKRQRLLRALTGLKTIQQR